MPIRVGFIGLGNIGKPMARRIVDGGFPLSVFDVLAEAATELVAAGAAAAGSAREVAETSDILGICVRDDEDLKTVVLGDQGILAGSKAGSILAIHSTVLPRSITTLAVTAGEKGVAIVDACITGGATGASEGKLTYMVGGAEADVERCRPVFETSAARIIHTGALGTGAATKLCNNLMTYLGFLAAFESMSLAHGAGLSEEALELVTRANGNLTDQMLAFLTLHRLPDNVREDPGFRRMVQGFARLAEKDLEVTLAFAREHGVPLPGTARCRELIAHVYGATDA